MQDERLSKVKWCYFASILIGVWLIFNALSFSSGSSFIFYDNLISGSAIVLLGALSLQRKFDWLRWFLGAIGCWLLVAPLVFWAPTAQVYDSNTLAGALLITFSFLLPGMPRKAAPESSDTDVPPGWSFNPSSWQQRGPLIALAFVGFFCARYLASFQLGYIDTVWDPFFGSGTRNILTSDVSHAFPVSDAGLGAFSYMIDALAGFAGGRDRWRTMPWMVVLFGLLIIPPGITSVTLVILQPVAVGAWCGICLFTSAVMLIMVPLAFDEIVATLQYLYKAKKSGKKFWTVFWFGGGVEAESAAENLEAEESGIGIWRILGGAGVTLQWTLVASFFLGAWMMSAPALLGFAGVAANFDYFTGALVVTFSITAMAEVSHSARLLNIPIAIALIISPLFIQSVTVIALANQVCAGIILVLISIPRAKINARFGGLNKYIY
ncbi:MAG: vitamin K epoxide reductase family protein [Candidatus Obscuribacterales bacterium]|nr:vitamin K epoxide reductase family protein [Candidatus Obscuribacterales bacterium]